MFDKKKVKELVLSSLVADAYSLGSHWVYDEKELENLDIDWDELNDAKAPWHKGKMAGDFTHYGDQTLWLYEFLKDKDKFDADAYVEFWADKMSSYDGYIDGSSKDTLINIKNNISASGASSTDLSIVGRIAPLLLVSNSKKEFLQNVESFVKCTHNSDKAITTAKFFATLLLEVLDGKDIKESIMALKDKFDAKTEAYVDRGVASKSDDTLQAIRDFGPSCDIDGGFVGVVHLLYRHENLKEMLIANAKAGGDSSARAMLATIIFMAQKGKNISDIPASWLKIKAYVKSLFAPVLM
ncbi:hypothetical protein M947_07535 [Sulfurimonas hongkongensis]|uniref:ADP-ribosylglycohydrolase n=1 Tax=Sulfurimonas hongkongensis TaxID=1172190 RepID=T0JR33_9BACT|nr:ADP-ribosylglycohydrolase family protein [Sulfurimonas hongkongensis]EQB39302.1 hypothetical protein M947_07535 [Sulfurimonas hongkongensis]